VSEGSTAPAPDAATALGLAVVLLALAGICALLGAHFLLGALRLAAGLLAGAGLGVLLLALLGGRLRRRMRMLLAAGLALVVAAALTVPAVLATRPDPLEAAASATLAPLREGDAVHSAPGGQGPVLVRRADGTAQLVSAATGVEEVEAAPEDVLALSADGTRLVQVTDDLTRVREWGGSSDTEGSTEQGSDDGEAGGSSAPVEVPGTPLALAGDVLVVRACEDGTCRLSGVDLGAPDQPLWTVADAEQTRGPDPVGTELPAGGGAAPGLLDAVAATGVLPEVPLRFDPDQGWLQVDPATGFPVGRILAPADADCRIAATPAPSDPQAVQQRGPQVLTVCAGEGGELTATAHEDGEALWESAPSPAGDWTVRLDAGRVLAAGTEQGTTAEGEILASERQSAWEAPGGQGVDQAEAFTARLGIDGTRMVVTNASGQLVAYDTATGANLWTLPLDSPDAEVRGDLGSGTVVVLDEVEREHPLDPRGLRRLRVVDAADGTVTAELVTAEELTQLRPLSDGRALVSTEQQTVLLGG
jgi:hypothetical protein